MGSVWHCDVCTVRFNLFTVRLNLFTFHLSVIVSWFLWLWHFLSSGLQFCFENDCCSYVCSICACLVLSVSSSSWCLGRAVIYDCGTPWTFLLLFFISFLSLQASKKVKGPGSATITSRSPSQAPRGRGNRQKLNKRKSNKRTKSQCNWSIKCSVLISSGGTVI